MSYTVVLVAPTRYKIRTPDGAMLRCVDGQDWWSSNKALAVEVAHLSTKHARDKAMEVPICEIWRGSSVLLRGRVAITYGRLTHSPDYCLIDNGAQWEHIKCDTLCTPLLTVNGLEYPNECSPEQYRAAHME